MTSQNPISPQASYNMSNTDDAFHSTISEPVPSISRSLASPTTFPRLITPIAIPQLHLPISLSPPPPFARAHVPLLSTLYALPPSTFLSLLDNLNICIAHSAPFQALDLAALGVGMIPEPVAMGVSAGLDVVSTAGNEAVIWWRVRKLLGAVNGDGGVLGQRGLEMGVIKDGELTRLLGVDRRKVLVDLGNLGPSSANPVAEDGDESADMEMDPMTIRRYHTLRPHLAELDFNVPPAPEPTTRNLIDRLSAKEQARRAERKQQKILKRRTKAEAKSDIRASKLKLNGCQVDGVLGLEEVRSNAMAYDDSAGETSESDGNEDEEGSVLWMARKTRRVDERAEKIEKRYEKRLGKAEEEDKRVKLEEERRKELDRLEMEWRACRERFEKVQRRKNEKRVKRNEERMEKAEKKLEKLKWVVIVNKGDMDVLKA